jgi:membrane-associated phospholipid phosphatase
LDNFQSRYFKTKNRMTIHLKNYKLIFYVLFIIILFSSLTTKSQDSISNSKQVPISKFFYKFDKNIIGSYKYNYGLNYLVAVAGTFSLVGSDVDWNWYRFSIQNNRNVYNIGYPSVYTGWVVPFAAPIGLFVIGRVEKNNDLQITGLALGQAALDGWLISTTMKVFTGRVPPTKLNDGDDIRGDFRFGFLKGGANNGWPSSHTTAAFAMATTLAELYPDNTTIKICSFTYASAIALGVSTNIHWFSDAFAGALIGYAIGKTVGINYRNLMKNAKKNQTYNIYFTPTGAILNYWF